MSPSFPAPSILLLDSFFLQFSLFEVEYKNIWNSVSFVVVDIFQLRSPSISIDCVFVRSDISQQKTSLSMFWEHFWLAVIFVLREPISHPPTTIVCLPLTKSTSESMLMRSGANKLHLISLFARESNKFIDSRLRAFLSSASSFLRFSSAAICCYWISKVRNLVSHFLRAREKNKFSVVRVLMRCILPVCLLMTLKSETRKEGEVSVGGTKAARP